MDGVAPAPTQDGLPTSEELWRLDQQDFYRRYEEIIARRKLLFSDASDDSHISASSLPAAASQSTLLDVGSSRQSLAASSARNLQLLEEVSAVLERIGSVRRSMANLTKAPSSASTFTLCALPATYSSATNASSTRLPSTQKSNKATFTSDSHALLPGETLEDRMWIHRNVGAVYDDALTRTTTAAVGPSSLSATECQQLRARYQNPSDPEAERYIEETVVRTLNQLQAENAANTMDLPDATRLREETTRQRLGQELAKFGFDNSVAWMADVDVNARRSGSRLSTSRRSLALEFEDVDDDDLARSIMTTATVYPAGVLSTGDAQKWTTGDAQSSPTKRRRSILQRLGIGRDQPEHSDDNNASNVTLLTVDNSAWLLPESLLLKPATTYPHPKTKFATALTPDRLLLVMKQLIDRRELDAVRASFTMDEEFDRECSVDQQRSIVSNAVHRQEMVDVAFGECGTVMANLLRNYTSTNGLIPERFMARFRRFDEDGHDGKDSFADTAGEEQLKLDMDLQMCEVWNATVSHVTKMVGLDESKLDPFSVILAQVLFQPHDGFDKDDEEDPRAFAVSCRHGGDTINGDFVFEARRALLSADHVVLSSLLKLKSVTEMERLKLADALAIVFASAGESPRLVEHCIMMETSAASPPGFLFMELTLSHVIVRTFLHVGRTFICSTLSSIIASVIDAADSGVLEVTVDELRRAAKSESVTPRKLKRYQSYAERNAGILVGIVESVIGAIAAVAERLPSPLATILRQLKSATATGSASSQQVLMRDVVFIRWISFALLNPAAYGLIGKDANFSEKQQQALHDVAKLLQTSAVDATLTGRLALCNGLLRDRDISVKMSAVVEKMTDLDALVSTNKIRATPIHVNELRDAIASVRAIVHVHQHKFDEVLAQEHASFQRNPRCAEILHYRSSAPFIGFMTRVLALRLMNLRRDPEWQKEVQVLSARLNGGGCLRPEMSPTKSCAASTKSKASLRDRLKFWGKRND